jgi:hypothetical protein
MTDPLDRVLQLVAEGKLSAEDAAPILAALDEKSRTSSGSNPSPGQIPAADQEHGSDGASGRTPRFARIEVRERGKRVVDLRVPMSLGRFALARVPGLSSEQISEFEQAASSGAHGPLLDIEDADGDGVRIVLE